MPQTVHSLGVFTMAVALLGYFSTMVATLAALMFLLNGFLTSPLMQKPKPQPYPAPAIEQTAAPDKQPAPWGPPVIHKAADGVMAANAEDARLASEKDKRLKLARAQKRKDAALQQDQQERPDSMALSYNQEQPQQPMALSIFNRSHR
jgi:cell division protein FtsN